MNSPALDQFKMVLHTLLKRAREDEVNWDHDRSGYVVRMPSSAIEIQLVSPVSEPDYCVALLYNAKGNTVQTLRAEEADPDESDWQLLSALFDEAHRTVTGWDKALADAEASVKSKKPVGGLPAVEPITDDDIPF